MAPIRLSRWHVGLCAIALASTIAVPWQISVIAILAIVCDLLFRLEHVESERRWDVPGELVPHRASSHRVVQLPIPLVRLLGADCAECRGIGCQACAHTGLG